MNGVSTRKYKVIDSNELIIDEDDDISIPIDFGDEGQQIIHLIFKSKDGDSLIKMEMIEKELYMYLINFNNPLGRFTTHPIHIGEIDGKELSIHIYAALCGTTDRIRLVKYTLLLEK